MPIGQTLRADFETYSLKYTLWSMSEYSYTKYSVLFLLIYYTIYCVLHVQIQLVGNTGPLLEGLIKVP